MWTWWSVVSWLLAIWYLPLCHLHLQTHAYKIICLWCRRWTSVQHSNYKCHVMPFMCMIVIAWLVVSAPLKKMSQSTIPNIRDNNKCQSNHQLVVHCIPDTDITAFSSNFLLPTGPPSKKHKQQPSMRLTASLACHHWFGGLAWLSGRSKERCLSCQSDRSRWSFCETCFLMDVITIIRWMINQD